MQLHRDTIAPEGLDLTWAIAPGTLAEMLGPTSTFEATAPARVSVEVSANDDTIVVSGHLIAKLTTPCARCVTPVAVTQRVKLQLAFVPRADKTQEAGDAEGYDEAGWLTYENDIVDLGQAVKDELLLDLPLRSLCNPTCRGLCPSCGINRNEASCSCDTRTIDPRLMALADIKLDAANQHKGK